jgi:hypothetical protein
MISGKAESGKDTTAQILKEKLEAEGKKVAILHFAKYIKDYLRDYMGWNGEKTDEWRTLLQKLGTEVIKQDLKMPNFHVNRVVEDIQILEKLGFEYFIIPDTRFKNEVYYTLAKFPYDTISVRVHRLNFENSLSDEQRNHPSECDLDDFNFDYNIYVQNGVDHLKDEINRVFKTI